MPLILLLAKHAAALVVLFLAAAGAGTLAAGSRPSLALRSALGLMLWAHALFALAAIGQLRLVPIVMLVAIAIAGGAWRGRSWPRVHPLLVAAMAPAFLLALHPPLAFDETLYHLPYVRALAESGRFAFLPALRFPVFPQLHELLCVPLFLIAGDTSTHLVALLETAITAALLFEWGRRHHTRAGLLAAALFAGSPIVVQLATITYVDPALVLFVTAGFFCLDDDRPALAGFFLGTATGVKYLGWFFAAAAFFRRRSTAFAACCLAAALPTTLRLIVTTGDPLFPFLNASPWALPLPHADMATRIVRTLTLAWNVTFARTHVNQQPPVTPFLIVMLAVLAIAAIRDVRARIVAVIVVAYVISFSFLPQDTRYLLSLLPLISIVAAVAIATRWPSHVTRLAAIVALPGLLYPIYAMAVRGLPPATPAQREAMLARRIPAYTALMHAGRGTIYAWGGEELKYHARGTLLGDHNGPYAFDRVQRSAVVPTAERAASRRPPGDVAAGTPPIQPARTPALPFVQWLLVDKRAGAARPDTAGMQLVYEDAAAQLWSARSESAERRRPDG